MKLGMNDPWNILYARWQQWWGQRSCRGQKVKWCKAAISLNVPKHPFIHLMLCVHVFIRLDRERSFKPYSICFVNYLAPFLNSRTIQLFDASVNREQKDITKAFRECQLAHNHSSCIWVLVKVNLYIRILYSW